MGKDNNQPVGKLALLGAILSRHIDPRLDLLAATETLALASVGADGAELAEQAVEPIMAQTAKPTPSKAKKTTKAKKKTTKPKKAVEPVEAATEEAVAETVSELQAAPGSPAGTEPDARKHHWWSRKNVLKPKAKLLVLLTGFALVVAVVTAGTYGYYGQRVLPGLKLAGQPISGLSRAELKAVVSEDVAKLDIQIQNGETTLHPTLDQLGISIDVDSSVDAAFQTHRHDAPQERFAWWRSSNIPLAVHIDKAKLDAFNKTIAQQGSQPATDAKLLFAGDGYIISPEKNGLSTGVEKSVGSLASGLQSLDTIHLTVSQDVIKPKVVAADLKDINAEADLVLNTPISFTFQNQVFQPTKGELNQMLIVNTDPSKQPYNIEIDNAKVDAYVAAMAKAVSLAPIDKKVTSNQDQGGITAVIQEGRAGRQLKGQKDVSAKLTAALKNHVELAATLETDELAFNTVSYNTFDRYIDVNVTTKQLVAYEKGVNVGQFPISAGAPATPSEQGEFAIYKKTRVQAMYGGSKAAGTYWYLPNIQWISWFNGGAAIHGAYWHNLFGIRNTSHGCINMRIDEAKFIFEWAPVGTKVVVHA